MNRHRPGTLGLFREPARIRQLVWVIALSIGFYGVKGGLATLATAGGLVFTGEGGGEFKAYDAETGAVLWNFQAGAGVNAPPASYTVDGRQFVVVGAGGNTQLDYKRGNSIIAFSLAD